MIYLKYLKSLLIHKYYVFLAGYYLKVPIWRLIVHDYTKFYPIEFINYAQWHFGKKDKLKWANAWLHHKNLNPHHPEYWMLSWRGDPDFYSDISKKICCSKGMCCCCIKYIVVLPMPKTYIREMIADWCGAGKSYAGEWDVVEWYNKNKDEMYLHDDTIKFIDKIMKEEIPDIIKKLS